MKIKIIAASLAAALCLAFVPAFAGCSQDTYVEYTLYDSDGDVVRVDKLEENPSSNEEELSSDGETSANVAEDGYYYIVTGYGGKPVDVVIPSEISGVQVKGIGEQAFISCRYIQSLVVEEGVETTGGAAFAFCTALKSVELPSTISMEYSMFAYCTSLESIVLPEGIECISNRAFYGCSSLENINADANLQINLPSTLTDIEFQAFYGCSSLEGKLVIPEKVTVITSASFAACSGITEVEMSDLVTKIDYAAFTGCSSLNQIILSSSLEYIGSGAFAYCTSLKEISIPESVTVICSNAFQSSALESAYIPDGRGFYLYTAELEEGETPGSEEAEDKLSDYSYDGDFRNKGYLPSTELSEPAKAAGYLTSGSCVSLYWYARV